MESLYGDDDVSLVMNPVDLNQFNACQRTKKDPTTVGFLYTRSPRKNVALAVSALEKARSRVPGLRAVAFGADEPNKELPLPSWIEFHYCPPQSRIPDLYAACDAWLFTSESEGFGLPILEAMACRTPVLATAAGAAPEIVDETNGMLLPSDADAFAAAIVEFASMSAGRWRTLSDNALAQARRHEWSQAVVQFEAALHYAMSKSASHSTTIK
ncbi:MAG: glycosyltransferase family 4 protein [Gammaproteobacteria bacterium]|nr:glycosyltransferase family 4 protein [Gammaproteobacteria bacterium]